MKDYKNLIEALRCNGECHDGCAYRSEEGWCDAEAKMDADAATAIEELLPKQGEWVDGDARRVTARCSVCGRLRLGNGAEWANKHVHFLRGMRFKNGG